MPLLNALLEPRLGYVARTWPDELFRRVDRVAERAGIDALSLLLQLARHPIDSQLDEIVGGATVSHTAFFRHVEQFDALRHVLRQRYDVVARPLRIWSAGCATGQEPYSIALCAEAIGVPIELLATDVSPHCIAFARRGEYPARSTRGLPGELAGRPWRAPAALRARIRFEAASIAQQTARADGAPRDVIFCRNVLLYFEPPRATQVLRLLAERLAVGGTLAVAPAEVLIRLPDNLERTEVPGFAVRAEHAARARAVPLRPRASQPVATAAQPAPAPQAVPEAARERAARELAAGELDAAEATLRDHLEAEPRDACAWFLFGETLLQRQELAQARVAFHHAARFASDAGDGVEAETLRAAAQRRAR